MTLEPPVLVSVSDKASLLPTVTLPKLRLLGVEFKAPNASPVPTKGMFRVRFEAFEVMVTLPLAVAVVCGVNVAVKVVL